MKAENVNNVTAQQRMVFFNSIAVTISGSSATFRMGNHARKTQSNVASIR